MQHKIQKPRDWALDLALALAAGIALLAVVMIAVILGTSTPPVADTPTRPQVPQITAQTNGACADREVAKAREITGEHEIRVDWVTREAANREFMSGAAAWTDADRVAMIRDMPCEYVAFVAAHEFGHVAQDRRAGSIPRAWKLYGAKELERVAQCFAMAFALNSYPAYGVGSWTDCTAYEKRSALELMKWVR